MGDQFAGATLLAVGQSSNATIFSYFSTLQKPWQRVIGAVGLWSSSEKHTLQRGVLDNFSCMVENLDPGCGECFVKLLQVASRIFGGIPACKWLKDARSTCDCHK